MTTIRMDDDDSEITLLGPMDATFDIFTWCSDEHGQNPDQVHLVIEPVPGTKILYRFTGPVALTELIDALTLHREDVWPGYSPPDGSCQ